MLVPVLVSNTDITSPTAVGRSGDTLLLFVRVSWPVLVSNTDIISPTAVGRSGDTLLWFVLVLFRPTCMFADSDGRPVRDGHTSAELYMLQLQH